MYRLPTSNENFARELAVKTRRPSDLLYSALAFTVSATVKKTLTGPDTNLRAAPPQRSLRAAPRATPVRLALRLRQDVQRGAIAERETPAV